MPSADEGGEYGREDDVARGKEGLDGCNEVVGAGVIPIFGGDCEGDGGRHDELD